MYHASRGERLAAQISPEAADPVSPPISGRRDLPTGTVTLLFTDIEGSTKLLAELGDQYAEALSRHRTLLRDAFAASDGVEVDVQGDAFFYAFMSARDAAEGALRAQEALTAEPICVRIGIHTGEPALGDEGYVGMDVHRAARIMAAAHGGQVLVSSSTREVLGADERLHDMGDHRLKDLSAPIRLYQLGDGEFPRLRTLHQTNLPVQPYALIGRERELSEIASLLRKHRLVTLVGPGGTGKTRLALQVAADTIEGYPDGAWWVPLTPVTDPERVEGAIAAAVGADGPLADYLRHRRALLLVDNFEQIVTGAEHLGRLLEAADQLRILVTSREPLRIRAEHRYAVDPLPEDDAVTLFVERARAVEPAFAPDAAVASICRRLDRLPLAVELAAARIGLLLPADLLSRLDRALPLLTGGARDAPERQRTLRATIAWSHALCSAEEQVLFSRLAVFAGGWTLEAAEEICDAEPDLLERLVDRNLIRRWPTGRFAMLDTLHEFAVEQLEQSSEVMEIGRRHAQFFLGLAESAGLNAGLIRQGPMRFDIAFTEQENIRGALAWAIAAGEVELALKVAAAMEQFWPNNDPQEGVRWFTSLLEMPGFETASLEARGHALRAFGSSAFIGGDPAQAEQVWKQSLELFEELGDEHGEAVLLHRLGISAMVRGDLERARELVAVSHEIHERGADLWGQAQTVGTMGAIERDTGNAARAHELIERSAELASEIGVRWWWGGMLAELAASSLNDGKLGDAEAQARQALELATETKDWPGRLFGVGLLAAIAAERGQSDRAGRLWGAIEDADAMAPLGGWRRHRAECAARLDALESPEFERARSEGRNWTLDEAVEFALG